MDYWLNLNKRPCWDSIRDPFASEANPWTAGLSNATSLLIQMLTVEFTQPQIPHVKASWLVQCATGLQKMFSLSGTIKSNGQNFLSNMCMKHTSQAHNVKSLWAGFRPRAFWRSLVQSAPIFEPFLCKYYYFLVFSFEHFLRGQFFSGTGGPMVLWIL